jgi:hypothetical protein
MRSAIVAAILAILVVATFGAGYLAGNKAESTETLTSMSTITSRETVTSTTTSTSTEISLSFLSGAQTMAVDANSSIGIDLVVGLNSTTIVQGQDIPNVVEVVNTLPRVNNVSVSHDFPVGLYSPKCDPGDDTPLDVEMYSGYYDMGNISTASPLPYERLCPAPASASLGDYKYYLFQPSSTNATLYGLTLSGAPSNSGPMSLNLVNQTSLYQFMSSFPEGVHPVIPVGVYTLVVQDFWGQIVILHFSVVS